MAGNVWEWEADWYQSDYYASSPDTNPTGPDSGINKVMRGGSWGYLGMTARVAFRNSANSTVTFDDDIGFRCARSP